MNLKRETSFWGAALAAALFLVFPDRAPGQNRSDERDNFHNTAFIKTDNEEVKAGLFQFGEALKERNHEFAVTLLIRVLKLDQSALIPFGERTFMNLREVAMRRISRLPEDVLVLYMDRAGKEGERLLEERGLIVDADLLEEITSRFPLTKPAFSALLSLGDMAFERGEYSRAARRFGRFIEEASHLDSTAFAMETSMLSRAHLGRYIALRMAGRREDADRVRPSGPFIIEGRRKDLGDLEALLEASEPEREPAEGGWPTRGGHRSRYTLPPFEGKDLVPLWDYPLKKTPERRRRDPLDPITLGYLNAKPPEARVYPIVHRGVLLIFDETALYPFDLEKGTLLYGPHRWDWSLLLGDRTLMLENVTYSGTAARGVLYAALNLRSLRMDRSSEHKGVLMALDLEREGYALWRRGGGTETEAELRGVAFTGAPTVAGERVYIMGTRYKGVGEGRAEAHLFCFDAATGDILFDRFLCSGGEVDRFEIRLGSDRERGKDRVELGSPIAEYGGVLYCLTNLGVLGAVDAFSGRILWLFKYNRVFPQDPDRFYPDFILDTGGWHTGLPVVKKGRLYVTPRDSRFFYCLDLMPDPEGYIILDDPIEKGRMVSLIGIGSDLLYFSAREGGRNYVIATDPNGFVDWETHHFEEEDRITGRPLLCRSALFVPTERYIYRLDLGKEGLVTDLFPLPPHLRSRSRGAARFGNIIAIRDYLVSVSREDVIVFKGTSE